MKELLKISVGDRFFIIFIVNILESIKSLETGFFICHVFFLPILKSKHKSQISFLFMMF